MHAARSLHITSMHDYVMMMNMQQASINHLGSRGNASCLQPHLSHNLCTLLVQVVQVDGLELPIDAAQVASCKNRESQQRQQLPCTWVIAAGIAQAYCHCQASVVCYHLLRLQGRSGVQVCFHPLGLAKAQKVISDAFWALVYRDDSVHSRLGVCATLSLCWSQQHDKFGPSQHLQLVLQLHLSSRAHKQQHVSTHAACCKMQMPQKLDRTLLDNKDR